jgi:hypothetical protein
MNETDYIKQLEDANQNLLMKLEGQADVIDNLSIALLQARDDMNRSRLVVLCADGEEPNLVAIRQGAEDRELVMVSQLAVVPASEEEKLKVYEKYHISPQVRLSLFKTIKDRNNKTGSFYDIDLLNKYSRGEIVKPYVI